MDADLLRVLWASFTEYQTWLDDKVASPHTRRAYRSRINHFLVFLATNGGNYTDVLKSARVRDRAVAEYKDYLRSDLSASSATINTTLATLDHFYRFLGMGEPNVERQEVTKQAPIVLSGLEQRRLLSAIDKGKSKKDRAITLLLMHSGMRLGECAALDLSDLNLSQALGTVRVRSTRQNRCREIGLNELAAQALEMWLKERNERFAGTAETAVFLNPQGKRISTAGIDLIVRKVGKAAGIELSTEILRQTCMVSMLVGGQDLAVVRKMSGHKRRETTKRYRPITSITLAEEESTAAISDLPGAEQDLSLGN